MILQHIIRENGKKKIFFFHILAIRVKNSFFANELLLIICYNIIRKNGKTSNNILHKPFKSQCSRKRRKINIKSFNMTIQNIQKLNKKRLSVEKIYKITN